MNRSSNGFGLLGVFIAVIVMTVAAAISASPESQRAGGDVTIAAKSTDAPAS